MKPVMLRFRCIQNRIMVLLMRIHCIKNEIRIVLYQSPLSSPRLFYRYFHIDALILQSIPDFIAQIYNDLCHSST